MDTQFKVDSQLESLIPAPSPEELAILEKSLINEGCRDPFVVYEPEDSDGEHVLLYGHNRFRLCKKHNIEYPDPVIAKEVHTIEDARDWILHNQMGRRNLTPGQISYLRGCIYNNRKQQGKPLATSGQSDQKPATTAEAMAKELGVSEKTIRRDTEYAKAIDHIVVTGGPTARQKLLDPKLKLTRKNVRDLSRLSPDDINEIMAEDGDQLTKALKAKVPPRAATRKPSQEVELPEPNAQEALPCNVVDAPPPSDPPVQKVKEVDSAQPNDAEVAEAPVEVPEAETEGNAPLAFPPCHPCSHSLSEDLITIEIPNDPECCKNLLSFAVDNKFIEELVGHLQDYLQAEADRAARLADISAA